MDTSKTVIIVIELKLPIAKQTVQSTVKENLSK